MQVTHTIDETRAVRAALGTVAFVPTMGALHEGHLSLIRRARELADRVVVSIFVNPTQFNDAEDLTKYPRPLNKDLALCEEAGVSLVFAPEPQEMYPADEPELVVDVPSLTGELEGAHRPGHFVGVCRVCLKLFNIVQADYACFGQKDYQQLRVIETMVQASCMPLQIVACPTVRETDGLAMSSRNVHLEGDARRHALGLSKALREAELIVQAGETDPLRVEGTMGQVIEAHHGQVNYAVARDPRTLAPLDIVDPQGEGVVLLVAAEVGGVRLLDNRVLGGRASG